MKGTNNFSDGMSIGVLTVVDSLLKSHVLFRQLLFSRSVIPLHCFGFDAVDQIAPGLEVLRRRSSIDETVVP